jgi:signal transduction histidine kinase
MIENARHPTTNATRPSRADRRVTALILATLFVATPGPDLPAQAEARPPESTALVRADQVDPATLPVTRIEDLRKLPPDRLPPGLVRIQAAVLPNRARDLLEVTDGTGMLFVRTSQPNRIPAGDRHDFVGRMIVRAGQVMMDDAQFTLLRRLPTAANRPEPTEIENLHQLQRLAVSNADQSLAVKVRAVATYVDRPYNTLMVQDGTAGTWVGIPVDHPEILPGMDLEIVGFTAPGDFAPIVVRPQIRVLGRPGLPEAPRIGGQDFRTGSYDGRRVALEGIVRATGRDGEQVVLTIISDGERFDAKFPVAHPPVLPPRLTGARVRITGVCSAHYSQYQQFGGFELMVNAIADVEVLEPGPADPFTLPVRPIRELIRFDPDTPVFAPAHITGTVLLVIEGQRLVVRDDSGLVDVTARDTAGARPSDRISAVGYPQMATFGPRLRDAFVKVLGPGTEPTPLPVDPESNRMEMLHGELLQIDAIFFSRLATERGTTLILRAGSKYFDAELPGAVEAANLPPMAEGATLRIKGVLQVAALESGQVVYRLLLRTGRDVTVLARPPWWTLSRAMAALGAVVLVSSLMIAWVAVQRRRAESRLRRQEEELRQAQKMEAIGTLAGGIAHDFNNILTGILGHTELALMNLPPDSPLRNDLESVQQAGRRARDLTRQILTYSRRIDQPRRPVALAKVVAEVGRLLRATVPTTIYISLEIDENSPWVLGDDTQLHQVLMNLGTNAYHATRERGGTITISLRPHRLDTETQVGDVTLPNGNYAMLVVADDGTGMTAEVLARVFEPYYTTKKADQGSGLGLAVVLGIVRAHGGAITATSEPGKGTTMTILLPATAPVAAAPENGTNPPLPGRGRILLVDDEPMIAGLGKRMLERLGYEVAIAFSGSEALACVARDPRFDLVVTDQTMPQLTGLNLLERLKEILPGVPVIICTGYSETLNATTARQHGAAALIDKPYRQSDLAAAVAKALARS